MPLLLLVFLFGTSINVANAHPHSKADVVAELTKEFTHPVVSAGGPYNN